MFMFKVVGGGYLFRQGYAIAPDIYNHCASKIKLSDKRKAAIEERRSQLKMEDNDPPVLRIVKEEMLAYKPVTFTLDDRYHQLEQILDHIDKANTTKQTPDLVAACEKMATEIALDPGKFKNAFLERLQSANTRISAINGHILMAKL